MHAPTVSSRAGETGSRTVATVKYVVLVPDGCADEPVDELAGQTPLEAASLPTNTSGPGDPLIDVVATLPLAQRTAIVMRYWCDLPDDEIAAALSVRPASVRSLIHRALKRLDKEIDR